MQIDALIWITGFLQSSNLQIRKNVLHPTETIDITQWILNLFT